MWQRSVEEHGFAIIPDVLAGEDISRLSGDLADAQLHRSRAGVRHALRNPAVAGLAQDSRLLRIADGVIYAHAPADARSQVTALRVHLDDSTAQNGPLRVLPATHRLGVLTDDEIHQLSTQVSAVDCVVPTGGVLAMRPLIVHASSKSQSESARRVLHIEYAACELTADGLHLAVA